MTNLTDQQIIQLAADAAAHGDEIEAAIYYKSIGYDYSEVDLSPTERTAVDHLTVNDCR